MPSRDPAPAPAAVPAGQRAYAVGDVHGCLDRLQALRAAIAEDLAQRPVASATLIHLGDYVDRGPDSAGVLALLEDAPPPAGITAVVNLMGNHEAMMLAAIAGWQGSSAAHWMMNGGEATLRSFGLDHTFDPAVWAARLPPARLAFLRGLTMMHRLGGYVFVHAGIRPGIPLARQSEEDLLWIREPFLSSSEPFEAVVVHGHTPILQPVVRPNRIGIDTGAVMGGDLTCAVLEASEIRFLTA